jgi:DNA-binding XRE family transcriptional regulator
MPDCPRCGAKPDRVALERDQYEMDQFRELLAEMKERIPGWSRWRKVRIAAGLTLGQAARLLGVERMTLGLIEQGEASALPSLAKSMATCYDYPDPEEPDDANA